MTELTTILEYSISFVMLYITVFFVLLTFIHKNKIKPIDSSKELPFLSILLPAYNEETHIKKCILSVLQADYPKDKLEIIVIDDGSTDKTYEIVNSIKDGRIKLFRKENSGKAASLNFGLKKVRGKIISTLDADSYIEKNAIKKMMPYFEDEEVAAVTSAVKVKEEGRSGILKTIQKIEYIFVIFTRKILSYIDAVPVTPGPLSMFRKEVFEKVGPFDEKSILEDQEIALRIQSHNYRIESAIEAEVYTEVPENLSDLIKQRVRWHRGGIRNNIKYLNMISPNYGDFGIIIMPFTFIAILALIAVFILTASYYLSSSFYYQQQLGLDSLLLSLGPIHVIGITLIAINVVWIMWGLTVFKRDKVTAIQVFIYLITYSYLFTIYWAATFLKELAGQKITW